MKPILPITFLLLAIVALTGVTSINTAEAGICDRKPQICK
jgi:hypothetical protein